MTDEQDRVDPSLVKRKLTKRERLRGAVQRGVGKVKKSDEESTRDGEFSLSDDVKDFLAFRSPYSKPTAVLSTNLQSHEHDAKPATAAAPNTDTHEVLQTIDPSDVLPHFPTPSRDPLPVPRINVANSPRFPHARELLDEKDDADMVSALRIQDSGSPSTRKARRKGLAVRFSANPPTIIGEGGDDAETPTMYLSPTRSTSTSSAPLPETPLQLGQVPPSHTTVKPVTNPPQHMSPQYIPPRSLQSMEFDMTLIPGLSDKSMPIQPNPVESLQPTAARARRLRMRAEEGKTLRESFHEASFDSVVD